MSSKTMMTNQSSSGSAVQRSRQNRRAVAQTTADARLHAVFEQSGDTGSSFDYTHSIDASRSTSGSVPAQAVTAYLQRMQRGGLIQPFGCMLAVEESSFRVVAFSENAPEMLDVMPQSVPTVGMREMLGIGTDARTLFTAASAASLEKAVGVVDVSMLNPITVHCRSSGKPFNAIVHRIDVGLVIDFEPLKASDMAVSAAGALQSHKLAAKAISRLQTLPVGDIGLLCDSVVEEVRELTGYDRVMAYKFHDDEHGEVVAEIRKSDLEPYLGLHYPATDIPQASRFLFMKNRVRMICDCRANAVRVIQDRELKQPLSLAASTLRAPHGCHSQYMANMGSIASLVMAVIVNDNEEETSSRSQQPKMRKLWGLVVCHHTTPRAVPFPLRSACEFLMQVFGLQLNMELELSAQMREKHILRTQTLLCDMLLRDAPIGIVSESPNIMDLVKCDGAALYYGNKFWLLGTTPTESQIKDLAEWLLEVHKDSTGLSTDSLADAGYPGAAALGDAVCGMAAAKITSRDFLFWFRSHTAKEIKWGGAKHDPDDRDDGRKMHPRSSFKAFLEVVKKRSLQWEDVEMDAIHSLQLILRGSFQDIDDSDTKTMIHARLNDLKLQGMDELSTVANEMVRLIETATAPIFAVDVSGFVNGWNAKVAELTGLPVQEAMNRSLVRDLVVDESVDTVERLLCLALEGEEKQNVEIKLKTYGHQAENGPVILIVNTCSSRDFTENVVGVCFVGQDVTKQKVVMDKFTRIQGDYKTIVQNPNPLIPPIFGADEFGYCTEWNPAMEKLSGWKRDDVIGKMLIGEVFGTELTCCRLRGQDSMTKFMIVLNTTMGAKDSDRFPFGFFDRNNKYVEALLIVHKRTNSDGAVTGVFCFLHTASPELQQALHVQKRSARIALERLKEVAYMKQEIRNPLYGIVFTRQLMESMDLTEQQKQILEISAVCERQLQKILDEENFEKLDQGNVELETIEFSMGTVMDAVISQGMITSREKGLQFMRGIPEELKDTRLFGDQLRLQQVLADFLTMAVRFTSSSDGWVEINVVPTVKNMGDALHVLHFEFRVSHPGAGIPEDLVQQMYDRSQEVTQEGMGLSISRKLLKLMNGDVSYIREPERKTSYFLIQVELPLVQRE
uniref:Phytochrome n=1 Tax=Pilularia globulifera TaxID=49509 RepID=A0A059UFC4_9MONI|nr:phytochrome [Pilularia globulifera]